MPDTPHVPYALEGRIVTMDDQARVIDKGVVYISDGRIAAVDKASASPPDGFEDCLRVNTLGTIYPGLIELHNHLSYNILPLWNVTGIFTNNGQWRNSKDKRQFISGPMRLLNEAGGYLSAIVRYVEAKCLVAGVTTSQGLTLINASQIQKKFKGIVRNAEEPDTDELPKAGHRIDDIDSSSPITPQNFLQKLEKLDGGFLLHLSEGIDPTARKHFLALEFPDPDLPDATKWAINDALIGIHAAALKPEDFKTFGQFGGSMVWSPLSNLLLYGATANVQEAKARKVLIALGSDWSPSGSKNLLAELKIARLYSQQNGNIFTDLELVCMVTSNPARMLKWNKLLGTIEKNKLADLLVIKGQQGGPYEKLLTCSEADVRLVVIGGTPRYGTTNLMQKFDIAGEELAIGDRKWLLSLGGSPDSELSTLTLQQARESLAAGLDALPSPPPLSQPPIPIGGAFGDVAFGEAAPAEEWSLVLDNDGSEATELRALLPLTTADVIGEAWADSIPLVTLVKPMKLDKLTIAEDPATYVDMLKLQPRLPQKIKQKLADLYGA
jgi:5-methylthioadenosine/S-adenosylhomocysteine deaminase